MFLKLLAIDLYTWKFLRVHKTLLDLMEKTKFIYKSVAFEWKYTK